MGSTQLSNVQEDWKDTVLELEQMLADGQMPEQGRMEELPSEVLFSAPILLRAKAIRFTLDGQLLEARNLLTAAVKGFALQADDAEMLSMLGLLTLLYVRIGDFSETETLLGFLAEEFRRTPMECGSFVPWALARGTCWRRNETLLQSISADDCFHEAANRIREAGDASWFALLILDRWLYDPNSFSDARWVQWFNQLRQWAGVNPDCEKVARIIAEGAADPDQAELLPNRYAYLVKSLSGAREPEQPNDELIYDVEIQLYAGRASVNHKIAKGELADAAAALRQFELLLGEMETPAAKRWLIDMKAAPGMAEELAGLTPLPSFARDIQSHIIMPSRQDEAKKKEEAHLVDAAAKWRVQLMSGIRFINSKGDAIEPKWKRKKSKELLVYLLLQPDYRALRDQVVEQVFGEGNTSKLANHLYVSLHELRSTLADIGIENAIAVRGGLIGFRDDLIDTVDVEQYMALSREADHLWADDQESAANLYMNAVRIYGLLGSDMPYVDWMERWRGLMLERQTQMLRRVSEFYGKQDNDSHTEQWLVSWIELRPDQEEAYQAMIRFWKDRGKIAESVSWYRKLERVCHEELGTEPLDETKRLIWED